MTQLANKHKSVFNTKFERMGDEESRTFRFVISTEARDRHGTIIKMDAWNLDNFNANPIVAYMHQTDAPWFQDGEVNPDHILGPGRAYIENGQLIGEVTFEDKETNPLADKIMRKIQYGTLRATSVGFRHISGHWGVAEDGEDTGTYYYDQVELLEFSIVNIPSNPEALMRQYQPELMKMLPKKTLTKPSSLSGQDIITTELDMSTDVLDDTKSQHRHDEKKDSVRAIKVRKNQLFINQNF